MLPQATTELIFHLTLIFARLGSAFSLFPAISERYLYMRGRLAIALSITFVLYPIINPYLPKYIDNISFIASLIAIEILIGIIISIAAKFYFWTLHIVGQIISMQSGLSAASFFDPAQRSQVAIFTSFLMIIAVVAIFVTDTHHIFIKAVASSYLRFPPGEMLAVSDISKFISHVINDSFIVAFKMASPFLIISLAILAGSGVLSRLMPNLQVFFVITPAQILVMFATLYIVVNVLIEKVIAVINESMNLSGF